MRTFLFFTALIITLSAKTKTLVYYVGGCGSTEKQVSLWKALASKEQKYSRLFEFQGISIGNSGPDAGSIINHNQALIQAISQKINSMSTEQKVIMAGHGSGVALAYEVARKVKNKSKMVVVSLDGLHPGDLQDQVETRCWSTIDQKEELLRARHYHVMKSCVNYREIRAANCSNSMCLHYVLINQKTPEVHISDDNHKVRGYEKLRPTLLWLDEFIKTEVTKKN